MHMPYMPCLLSSDPWYFGHTMVVNLCNDFNMVSHVAALVEDDSTLTHTKFK